MLSQYHFRSIAASVIVMVIAIAAIAQSGCNHVPSLSTPVRFASAEQVEESFRGKTFVLGSDSAIAMVRPPQASPDRWIELPFWLGLNQMVPARMRPIEGRYYVISEARLIKPLDAPGEWMIEAGSSLIKRESVLVTSKTHYRGGGKILPTIVQFTGMHDFFGPDENQVRIPILREVSLPMKWTLGGKVPASYARYQTDN